MSCFLLFWFLVLQILLKRRYSCFHVRLWQGLCGHMNNSVKQSRALGERQSIGQWSNKIAGLLWNLNFITLFLCVRNLTLKHLQAVHIPRLYNPSSKDCCVVLRCVVLCCVVLCCVVLCCVVIPCALKLSVVVSCFTFPTLSPSYRVD